jgi:hypothetical protein
MYIAYREASHSGLLPMPLSRICCSRSRPFLAHSGPPNILVETVGETMPSA